MPQFTINVPINYDKTMFSDLPILFASSNFQAQFFADQTKMSGKSWKEENYFSYYILSYDVRETIIETDIRDFFNLR